jgi:hypothetical protein
MDVLAILNRLFHFFANALSFPGAPGWQFKLSVLCHRDRQFSGMRNIAHGAPIRNSGAVSSHTGDRCPK